jgi:hypothetical protein
MQRTPILTYVDLFFERHRQKIEADGFARRETLAKTRG